MTERNDPGSTAVPPSAGDLAGAGAIAPGPAATAAPRQAPPAGGQTPPPAPEGPSFRQAMEELEGILKRIESEEIDIDQLAQELRRAAELLDLCRGKIRKAEVEVTQIVQTLEDSGPGDDRERP